MKLVAVLGVLGLSGSGVSASPGVEWKTLVSPEGRFSVRMPASVEESFAPSREQGGTVRQYYYKANIPFGNDYVVSCWDYTDAPRRTLDLSDLDSAVEAQRTSLMRKRSTVTKLQLGKVPGRELRIHRFDGKTDVFRLYLTGRRLYSISAIADGRAEAPGDARAFLASFRLLPN